MQTDAVRLATSLTHNWKFMTDEKSVVIESEHHGGNIIHFGIVLRELVWSVFTNFCAFIFHIDLCRWCDGAEKLSDLDYLRYVKLSTKSGVVNNENCNIWRMETGTVKQIYEGVKHGNSLQLNCIFRQTWNINMIMVIRVRDAQCGFYKGGHNK